MRFEDLLPTRGSCYGSGEAITELFKIIDEMLPGYPTRCDCDRHTRCTTCRVASHESFKREALKRRIQEYIDALETHMNNQK